MRACLSDEELFLLIDGALSDADARVLREHLDGCAACAKNVATLGQATACLAESPPLDISRHADAVLAAIDRPLAAPARRSWRRAIPVAVGAMATAAVLVLAIRSGLGRRPDEGFTARGGALVDGPLRRSIALTVQIVDGDEARPLSRGATLTPDVRFVASHRSTGKDVAYALVFGVDAQGAVHWLYPGYESRDTDPTAVLLGPTDGRDVLMGTAVSFDDLREGRLSIISMMSRTALRVSQIEKRQELSVEALRRDFPECDVVSIDVRVSR